MEAETISGACGRGVQVHISRDEQCIVTTWCGNRSHARSIMLVGRAGPIPTFWGGIDCRWVGVRGTQNKGESEHLPSTAKGHTTDCNQRLRVHRRRAQNGCQTQNKGAD